MSIWVRPAGVSTIRWPSCAMCRGWGRMSTSSSLSSAGQPWTADTQEPASSRALQKSAMARLQGEKPDPYQHRGQAGPRPHSLPLLPCPRLHIGEHGPSTAPVSPAMPTAGSALEKRQRIQLTPGPVHSSSSEKQGPTQGSKKPHPRPAAEPTGSPATKQVLTQMSLGEALALRDDWSVSHHSFCFLLLLLLLECPLSQEAHHLTVYPILVVNKGFPQVQLCV